MGLRRTAQHMSPPPQQPLPSTITTTSQSVEAVALPPSTAAATESATSASPLSAAEGDGEDREKRARVEPAPSRAMDLLSTPQRITPAVTAMVWADTSLWELAVMGVQAVRAAVDRAYEQQREREANEYKEEAVMGKSTAGGDSYRPHTSQQQQHQRRDRARHDEDEPLARYAVEFLTASLSADGKAIVVPLGLLELRQVVPGVRALHPSKSVRDGLLHPSTVLLDLHYTPGDPLFFSCTRTR